ncbi:MAG: cytochrome c biogenesis protein CcsA [Spirochaetaceae bacterium]|jgi:ABC-type uncharacterized transport system permease subunit|nr:cytochrome c biogenesis protein CcsA [Spirochaetaceae bacterium]
MLNYGNIFLSILYLLISVNYIILFNFSKKGLKITARVMVLLSMDLHLIFLFYIAVTEGRLALTTVFEVLSMIALFITIMLVILELKTGERSPGAFLFPLAFCLQVISLLGSRIPILDDSIIRMPLLSFHTLTTVFGYACFIYSFIMAVMYLYLLKRFKEKKYDKIFFGMPPLDLLEKLNIIVLFAGFVLMSIGLITGGWLAVIIWENIPLLDPKIFLTICLWFIYLVSLLARSLFKLQGKTMSYASILGFFLIIIIILLESLTQATLHRF